MSAINTNGINVNYPDPGVNNNSQGFRDNSAAIKTNLDLAGAEITDLQNNVLLKSSLTNSVVNNDMAGTLISNAFTRSFKASTYNLGNALSGTVLVDVSRGDVQFGSIVSNVDLQFTGWTSTGQNNIKLELFIGNSNAVLSFPSSVSSNVGVTTLENVSTVANVSKVTVPAGVTQLAYRLSTMDGGGNVTIEPYNRPRISSQVVHRSPTPNGLPGDVQGAVAVDSNYFYVCTNTFNSTVTTISVTATSSTGNLVIHSPDTLSINDPITFVGNVFGGISTNTIYYIKTVNSPTEMVISADRVAGVAGANLVVTDASWDGIPGHELTGTIYSGSNIWSKTALTTW